MKNISVNLFNHLNCTFEPHILTLHNGNYVGIEKLKDPTLINECEYYLSPGFIDSHAHIYDGATDLGINVEPIGLSTGVHLVVDAGSSGNINYPCFKKFVIPTYTTEVKAFLNISRFGLVTKQPYYDLRNIDIDATIKCIENNKDTILGIKVLSSGLIVEEQGLKPLELAIMAAEAINCKIMVHMAEGPPLNSEVIKLLRKGDIITHCFHGKPNILANKKASKSSNINLKYCSEDNIMWNIDGTPTDILLEALEKGVYLDVGHGAASFDKNIAKPVIKAGFNNFSISTDAHIRNINSIVYSLPFTMSKFLALGMKLEDIIASVTSIPSKQLGLENWCNDLSNCSTLFKLRKPNNNDPIMLDATKSIIEPKDIIEPIAILSKGKYIELI